MTHMQWLAPYKGNQMKYIIASVLLLIVVINISRKIANAITKSVLFAKPFVQLIIGMTWALGIAFVIAASIHFTHSGLVLTIIWYFGGGYMAYVSFGHEKRIMDAMAITNGASVSMYIVASAGLYFLTPLVLHA